MKHFLSCDWGTSSFRLRLVNAASLEVIAEEKSDSGIASTFALWNETGSDRVSFYLQVINRHIRQLEERTQLALSGTVLLLSGMASSSIGIMNLPYRELPFTLDGAGMITRWIKAGDEFRHDILLISGVKSREDIMRGEETQLIGCFTADMESEDTRIFIFPGTHSKHIFVKGKEAVDFKTYMTGECFELLARKSVLRSSVADRQDPQALHGFEQGVTTALHTNLLHAAFLVRTNSLLNKFNDKDNLNFLSGLLIGTELQELLHTRAEGTPVYLAGGTNLSIYYAEALRILGLSGNTTVLPAELTDKIVIKGQYMILQKIMEQ